MTPPLATIHSMTGFATHDATLPDGRALTLAIKSVNHRHLDLALRLPASCDALEPLLRNIVKAHVRRGHVELTMTLKRPASANTVTVDEPLLSAYLQAYQRAANAAGLAQMPDLNALLRMPGVTSVTPATPEDLNALQPSLEAATIQLLARFHQARATEGEALTCTLRGGMAAVETLAAEAAALREGVAAAEFARLRSRMADLLKGAPVSEDRLLTEAALLAGHGDIEEELVRLRTHVARFVTLLDAGGEVGRALDFLLQEMNREANTALSKTGASSGAAGLRLTEIGLAVKTELERAREQVQNLE